MHASAVIHAGNVQNVLVVPSTAIITNGASKFVLKQTQQGLVKTSVTIGLIGATTTEILSGLTSGDTVSSVGAQ
jgi:multidrug efflux pump subunit AcrA (membrane-fusion protein)